MVRRIFVLSAAAVCIGFAAQAEEHRQAGAHVHGHGRLNIAMDDKTLSIELEAPGADIAGFEHEANTQEDRAALEDAKAKLAGGLALFTPPPEAGCVLKSAKVSTEAEHEEKEEQGKAAEEHRHSGFHAEYAFECASPSLATAIAFGYFKAFPNAQSLDVSVISPKGQSSYEVTRDKPSLSLTGIL
jgi:hypothetical protein